MDGANNLEVDLLADPTQVSSTLGEVQSWFNFDQVSSLEHWLLKVEFAVILLYISL